MTTPDVVVAPPRAETVEDKSNGNAYWYFLPASPQPIGSRLAELRQYGDFTELPEVIDSAVTNGSVLLEGEPGSGKSHLVLDIQAGCVINDIPCYVLSVLKNSGKGTGMDNIAASLDLFRTRVGENGGIVILDNVDLVGYRGSRAHRSHSSAVKYAADARRTIGKILADPSLVTIGTAHTTEWRTAKYTWGDAAIDGPAHEILAAFGSRLVFEGKMSLMGLTHVLSRRGYGLGISASVIRSLRLNDRADFHHANHVDPELYLLDPVAAIAAVQAGRDEKFGKPKQ